MKNQRTNSGIRRRRLAKSAVAPGGPISRPLPQLRRLADVPGVNAILQRARSPYVHDPLSEDEALNLICDAREDEPTYPIKKLLKKLDHELGS